MGTGKRLLSPQELEGGRLGELSAEEAQTQGASCFLPSPDVLKEGWLPSSTSASSVASPGKFEGYKGQRKLRRAGSLYRCRLRDPRTEQEAGSPRMGLEAPK